MTTAEATPAVAVFELTGWVVEPQTDPLGLWRSPPATSATAIAFDTAVATAGTVWRVRLPANAAAADDVMTEAESRQAQSRLVLTVVEGRMRAFLAAHVATPFGGRSEAAARGQAEMELYRLLTEPSDAQDGAVGFAPNRLSGLWEHVATQAAAFLARLDEATADHSWVETEQGGRVLACTQLDWLKGTQSVWRAGSDPDASALHQRALALVFESRLTMVRIFATAMKLASRLVALFTPGGTLLAFPIGLRFVAQVLAEARA